MPSLGTKVLATRVKERVHKDIYEIADTFGSTPSRILNAIFLEDSDTTGAADFIVSRYMDTLYGDDDDKHIHADTD